MLETASQRFGKYLLYERIAVGGMAEVFRAKPAGSDKLLALKRIHPHHLENNDFVSMLIDEAKISVQLAHPNIIQVVDLGRVDHHYFIAMEYIAGRDLRRVIERVAETGRAFPVKHAVAIISRVARGLDYAHQKADARGKKMEIIHRDISPQNILVGFDGGVKVIDFGIAKAAGRLMETQVGILKGKYAYMSPEQATGAPLDHRTDIFSTGIMFYECASGKHPFRAPHDLETLRNIKNSALMPPREANAQINEQVEQIMLQALASKKENRYFTAGALADDLDLALEEMHPGYTDDDLADFLGEVFSDELAHGDLPRNLPAPGAAPGAGNTGGAPARRADRLGAPAGAKRENTGTAGRAFSNTAGSAPMNATAVAGAPPQTMGRQPMPDRGSRTSGAIPQAGGEGLQGFLERTISGRLTTGDSVFLGVFSVVVTGLAVAILLWDPGKKAVPGPNATPTATPMAGATAIPVAVKPNEMVVDSSPPGGDVRVRGQLLKGKTPIAIQGVPAGQKLEVTVSKAGFAPETKLVGAGERMFFALRSVPTGFVVVNSTPPGAEVRVGSALMGRSPLRIEVPAGDATIEVKGPAGIGSQKIVVKAGEESKVDLALRSP